MSKTITIGKSDDGDVKLDVRRLIVSRLLATADSGGGKSYLLRKILEAVSATTQTIVLDTEGEFATLREKRDMVLAGPDGEVPAEPRSAALLCRRLMELNLSAVVDLTDLTPSKRQEFVSIFCTTLVNLPRSLWHPCFVAIDEIHEYAPEGEKAASTEAVAALSTKGRKRGYCLIGATQRLSKLSKDVAAGLQNQLFGTFSLDTDIKRAAGALGFDKKRWPEIRDLSSEKGREGEFFGVGPAFNHRGVTKMRAGQVETTHPEAGVGRAAQPPAPSQKIKGVLDELKDLPQQAEAEIRDLSQARARIADLERQLRQQPKPQVKEVTSKQDAATIARLRKGLEDAMKVIAQLNAQGFEKTNVDPEQVRKAIEAATEQIVKLVEQKLSQRNAEFEKLKREANRLLARLQKLMGEDVSVNVDVRHNEPFTVSAAPHAPRREPPPTVDAGEIPTSREQLKPSEREVLDAAASFPGGATRQRVSVFSGRSIKSSSFQGAFPSLVAKGLLVQNGDRFEPTTAGEALANATRGASLADWVAKLKPSEAKVLQCLADAYPDRLTREQVSERTQQSTGSSSFQGAFPALRELGLIEGTTDFQANAALAGGD